MTLALTACALALLLAAPAVAERWEIAEDGGSEIVFTSKAPLESFKGRTKQVSGWVDFDPGDLAGPLSFEVAVDMASFDTGKKKRNQHMRDNHLETEAYPTAWFRGGSVAGANPVSLAVGGQSHVLLSGSLDLHGVHRDVSCEAVLSRTADGTVVIAAAFEVKLSDHDIPRPKFLVMKLADEQQVEVTIALRPGGGS